MNGDYSYQLKPVMRTGKNTERQTEQRFYEARLRGSSGMAKLQQAASADNTLKLILEVAEAMETDSVFTVLSFLLSKNPAFGRKTAFNLLKAGEVERVMIEARTFLRHGA